MVESAVARLPEPSEANAAPQAVADAVAELVRETLQGEEQRRTLACDESLLQRLAELLEQHLAYLAGFKPATDDSTSVPRQEGDEPEFGRALDPELVVAHEAAGAACLKLARNLCAGNPDVQERWWKRGLVERLAVQARADLASPHGERGAAWCEAVPSFMSNVIAGNAEFRKETLDALFPHGLAAVLAMCWRRPDLGFVLAQNLFAYNGGSNETAGGEHPASRLVLSPEGHCVLYILFNLLCTVEGHGTASCDAAKAAKAREWATVFFFGLWSASFFAPAFRGLRALKAKQIHDFLCAAAAVPGWGALRVTSDPESAASAQSAAASSFGSLTSRLCSRREALGLCWHTVHGLLAGPRADEDNDIGSCGGGSSPEALGLATALLRSSDFVEVAAEEMAIALWSLADAWDLKLSIESVSSEACSVLGLSHSDFEELPIAKPGARLEDLEGEVFGNNSPSEEEPQIEREKSENQATRGAYFRELLLAAVELAAIPRAQGSSMPAKLVGTYLSMNVAMISALHHKRFGTAAVAEAGTALPARQAVSKEEAAEAVKAARGCEIVLQLRLCGNILFDCPPAADFLRLSGGLSTLLSHCYSDHELPLLREAGIFAVRNALQHSKAAHEEVRALLAERKTRAAADAVDHEGNEGFNGNMILPPIDESVLL
eukprot:TRINITY_DN16281_c0_g3_i1.p1 TRINITY_DN16281_c0_g3~~TRINITY_DN16281_c0_g3_i1.p1  ORF type:complete len:663 (+),score=168.30 TRINITY_DN16281_c0_g3_i1:66-2054(+)